MAPSLDTLSLSQLLDAAIGMPNSGAIHFAAMRKLLQAVLGHLDGEYLTGQEPWTGQLSGPSLAELATDVKQMKQEMESYRKLVPKAPPEVSGGMKGVSDSRQRQEAQSRVEQDMKKAQEQRDQAMADFQNLREEIGNIKAAQSHMAQKMKKMVDSMKKMEDEIARLREDIAKWKEETSEQISQQMESVLQETKSELKKMEEQQEMRNTMLEQLVTEKTNQMQEKLGELEEIAVAVREEQEMAKAECAKCNYDYKVLLGELVQRCEKLQEEVDSLGTQQIAVGKVDKLLRRRTQDQQLLQRLEGRVRKIQGDCEELSIVSGSLQKDSEQKQKDIEMLFQSYETLKKDKANEQDVSVAMDLKADRAALGSKVSCTQFEAFLERLDERMQEMQSQVSGHHEHWNKVQEQLSNEMQNKLDRQEMQALHKQMKKTWQRSIEELEKKTPEGDSAAGMKKQLPVPFTCLSCDRTVNTQVPGPHIQTLPYLQPLPPIKEPQHSQRRTVVNGRVPRGPSIRGDNQSSSSCTVQPIEVSPRSNPQLQGLVTLPNKLSVPHLMGRGHHTTQDQKGLPPLTDRTKDEPRPATSREHRPATTRGHVSWAPQLVQKLQRAESL